MHYKDASLEDLAREQKHSCCSAKACLLNELKNIFEGNQAWLDLTPTEQEQVRDIMIRVSKVFINNPEFLRRHRRQSYVKKIDGYAKKMIEEFKT